MAKYFKVISFCVVFLSFSQSAQTETVIQQIEGYFPDEIGLSWTYQGSVADQVQRVAAYTNIAAVKERTVKEGVQVTVFTESNQSNQGPVESYFKKDWKGIIYYGGEPTTEFERNLVPYKVIPFPLSLNSAYSQIEKRDIPFGQDLDGDGQEELADVSAKIVVGPYETVSVPAGLFKDCLKFRATMQVLITFSKSKKTIQMTDTTTNWFAQDVGMVKGIERIEFPSFEGRSPTGTIIMEELSSYAQGKPTG